uniref:Secreted protein n=1 Tax=Syphacia muris TaxID=451379 RepID=A0A0N5B0Y6_9BILA
MRPLLLLLLLLLTLRLRLRLTACCIDRTIIEGAKVLLCRLRGRRMKAGKGYRVIGYRIQLPLSDKHCGDSIRVDLVTAINKRLRSTFEKHTNVSDAEENCIKLWSLTASTVYMLVFIEAREWFSRARRKVKEERKFEKGKGSGNVADKSGQSQ